MQVADSTTTSPIFRTDIRSEWINAIFGREFFPPSPNTSNGGGFYLPPKQGIGLARIASYLSYTVTVPAQPVKTMGKDVKVGVTLSRIPIGVYVRTVEFDSEAYCAGVVPGSVLVDVNGMGVLGEPSHKLLERLWLYEGHFNTWPTTRGNKNQHNKEEHGMDENHPPKPTNITPPHPNNTNQSTAISMKFIKDGRLYNVLLLSQTLFGISWAPCANFALVQRTYSFAQKAGVRRGCIVGAVNGKSLRDMDHLDTAMELKEQFAKGGDITITCVYTPAASRTGYHERLASTEGGSRPGSSGGGKGALPEPSTVIDGVRVRKVNLSAKKSQREKQLLLAAATPNKNNSQHPVEYGVGSFFSCGGANSYYSTVNSPTVPHDSSTKAEHNIVSEIANRVAAGEIAAPTGRKGGILSTISGNHSSDQVSSPTKSIGGSRSNHHQPQITDLVSILHSKYCNCPVMEGPKLLLRWNSLDAIVFCLRMHVAEYNEDDFYGLGGVIGAPVDSKSNDGGFPIMGGEDDDQLRGMTLHTREANVCIIKAIGKKTSIASDVFRLYLLQLVALVASEELYRDLIAEATAIVSNELDESSKDLQGEESKEEAAKIAILAAEEARCLSEHIMDSIVNVAMHDDKLCQDLHFLLRSFSSTLAKFKGGNGEAAFSPLSILSASHIQLRDTLLKRDFKPEDDDIQRIKSLKLVPSPNASARDMMDDYGTFDSCPTRAMSIQPSYSKDFCESAPKGGEDQVVVVEPKSEKKGVGKKIVKLFRSKSTKAKAREGFEDSFNETVSVEIKAPSSLINTPPSKATPKRKKSLRPSKLNSILRRGGELDPADEDGANESFNIDFNTLEIPPTAVLFENMGWFLSKLDHLASSIQRSLLKSFSEKITEWALQPWSDSKDKALTEGTLDMRNGLKKINLDGTADDCFMRTWSPVLNPVDSRELLLSVVPEESHILPSAKIPLLLTFNTGCRKDKCIGDIETSDSSHGEIPVERTGLDTLYKTKIEIISIRGEANSNFSGDSTAKKKKDDAYVVHAAIAGTIEETGRSALEPYFGSRTHRWHDANILEFETRTTVGFPRTMSIRLTSISLDETSPDQIPITDEKGILHYSAEVGCTWVDITKLWDNCSPTGGSSSKIYHAKIWSYDSQDRFDEQGSMSEECEFVPEKLSIEIQVTTEIVPTSYTNIKVGRSDLHPRRKLLYKHDDDMRQEALAVQFLETCDCILKASGLDLKLKKYRCIPVGDNRGFIEWVDGTVSLSELCKPMGSSFNARLEGKGKYFSGLGDEGKSQNGTDGVSYTPAFLRRGGWCKFESLRSLRLSSGLSGNNPVQDFLRSNAYDADAPYFIRKDVMDNFVKSCAGYSVITYLLGVGDRHTDNLLLHPNGYFLHCDYQFILGQDPKTYLPMRITEHMVAGIGGRDSDNFAMFLSLVGAAFISLRRHGSVRILLSLVRNMLHSHIPDVSINQSPDNAVFSMQQRFRLDLNDDEAVTFMEENVESSITSMMWVAVDAIHSLGKHF